MLKKAGSIEYKMSHEQAQTLLKARKGDEELRMHPQQYLCKVVNEQYGLIGNCIKVLDY